MKQTAKEIIIGKLESLPEIELREVMDFVDFISHKIQEHEDPVLKVAGILSGRSLSAVEIERELYGDERLTS